MRIQNLNTIEIFYIYIYTRCKKLFDLNELVVKLHRLLQLNLMNKWENFDRFNVCRCEE